MYIGTLNKKSICLSITFIEKFLIINYEVIHYLD